MRETMLSRRQAAYATVLGALAATVPAFGQGAEPDAESVDALQALLDEHNRAFTSHDMQGVLRVFAPNAMILGTGPGEIWGGHAEIKSAYQHFFDDFTPGKQVFENLWREGDVRGDLAWLLSMSKVTMSKEEKRREFGLNISVVFEKIHGKWLVRAMHFSNLSGRPATPAAAETP